MMAAFNVGLEVECAAILYKLILIYECIASNNVSEVTCVFNQQPTVVICEFDYYNYFSQLTQLISRNMLPCMYHLCGCLCMFRSA